MDPDPPAGVMVSKKKNGSKRLDPDPVSIPGLTGPKLHYMV